MSLYTTTLGPFFLSDNASLGEGAFGAVYKAKHYDQDIACKAQIISTSTDLSVLLNEMLCLKKLSKHENIIQVIEFYFTSSNNLLIFMELVPGGDLYQHVGKITMKQGCGMEEKITRRLFIMIGSALLYIHDCGFCHLDLKPGITK